MGPATPWPRRPSSTRRPTAQRRPARWGRQPQVPGPRPVRPRIAQRRPARWGRQPFPLVAKRRVRHHRSTKAGPVGPATPGSPTGRRRPRHRSTKAGPVGPATLDLRFLMVTRHTSLNEGRPGGAGNPLEGTCCAVPLDDRSTKAGPVGPATPADRVQPQQSRTAQRRPARWGRQPSAPRLGSRWKLAALNEGRPGGAGNPGCGDLDRRASCHRSTKAGPVGPATLGAYAGRPVPARAAQRRPARWGRQPSVGAFRRHVFVPRSTKAGPVGPATPHPSLTFV